MLKDEMLRDLEEVIFAEDELAEKVEIEGKILLGIFSNYTSKSDFYKTGESDLGLYQTIKILSLKSKEIIEKFGGKFVVAGELKINDEYFTVIDTKEVFGKTTLLLKKVGG